MKYIFLLTLTLSIGKARGQSKINQKEVYDMIVEQGIVHPKIVLKQAIHESANFKSKAAVQRNNIFGIQSGRTHFDSILSCVRSYKRMQQRYKGGNYYAFLRKIGYAHDPLYEWKVSRIKLQIETE